MSPLEELERIQRRVDQVTLGRDTIDREQVALDCWLEDHKMSDWLIFCRCSDQWRRERREHDAREKRGLLGGTHPDGDVPEQLNALVKQAQLSPQLIRLLYLRFWKSLSFDQIRDETGCPQVSVKINWALSRLRLASMGGSR